MQIGFAPPVSGSWATAANVVALAETAERLGYASLWTFQRVITTEADDWGEPYRSVLDPVVVLGAIAARTERIRLGIAVLNLPYVAPAVVAKQLATLDVLSNGRLDAGFGVGWSAAEFAAVGASMDRRGARAEEFLDVLEALWTREVTEYAGAFYTVPPSRSEPKPVQRPRPPILLGGTAEPALRRIGRRADGWISSSRTDLTAIGDQIRTIKDAAIAAGRDPDALRYVCRGPVRLRPANAAHRPPLAGSLDEIRGDLALLAEQGVTELFLDLNFDPQVGSPEADPAESLRRAHAVLEAFAPG